MKVLLINGSPHKEGCTNRALVEVAKELNAKGVDTEIFWIGKDAVHGCVCCGGCANTGKCVFDDLVNEVGEKLAQADGIVVGSPVYYASPNGTLISFLDRLFYSAGYDLRMKVGASVVVARRGGCTAAMDVLNKYFTISQMPVASSCYWNMIHGAKPGEASQDPEGIRTVRTLAKNTAFLMRSIAREKEENGLPQPEPKAFTNFIR